MTLKPTPFYQLHALREFRRFNLRVWSLSQRGPSWPMEEVDPASSPAVCPDTAGRQTQIRVHRDAAHKVRCCARSFSKTLHLCMATVDTSSPVYANFAATDSPSQQSAVGRMGPWQLVRLISESELARVYSARPADAPAKPAGHLRRQGAPQGMVARSARHRDAAPRRVGRPQGVAPALAAGAVGQRAATAVLHCDAEARRLLAGRDSRSKARGCRWP